MNLEKQERMMQLDKEMKEKMLRGQEAKFLADSLLDEYYLLDRELMKLEEETSRQCDELGCEELEELGEDFCRLHIS